MATLLKVKDMRLFIMSSMQLKTVTLLVLLVVLTALSACDELKKGDRVMSPTDQISSDEWQILTHKRVLFGHQSVGKNLIDGFNDVVVGNPAVRLNILETDTLDGSSGPVFAHFLVGSNTHPDSKIASFVDHLDKIGSAVDVAFFKFCYVDVGADTDVEGLFLRYRKTMAELKKKFPHIAFVHVTIPLTSLDSGLRGIVSKMRGKSIGEEINSVRTRYNNLLRKEYAGREPLFDLAAVESTAPDGSRLQGQKNGVVYEALCPQYTYDGGHLNELGRRRCALALLKTLAHADDSNKVKQ
jgi:hypothetical protein